HDPKSLYTIFESSSLLQPNVGAYSANIDQLGQYFEPVVPMGTDTDEANLREVLYEEDVVLDANQYTTVDQIPPSLVDALRGELMAKQLRDAVVANSFLRNCGGDVPFMRLRAEVRQDVEVTGNGFWEVLRDAGLRMRRFVRILPSEIKICALSEGVWPCVVWSRKSRRKVVEETDSRRVRLYKTGSGSTVRYLKEFRCRAIVSSFTGNIFPTMEAFNLWKTTSGDPKDESANEVLHFKNLTNLSDPYGVPRWIGALREVLGSTAVAEFNNSIFSNGLMLPLLILVSGGTLSPESVGRLRTYLEGMKGVENAHRAAILEATSGSSSVVPTVEVKELKSSGTDASFLTYDKRNEDRVGSQFRISDIVRGNTNTVANRATAEAALMQADNQVFAPIRAEFDWVFTNQILPEIGVTSLSFVSRGVTHTDAELIGKMAVEAVRNSILTPNEAREIFEEVFERELPQIDALWASLPPEVFRMAGVQSPAQPAAPATPSTPNPGGDSPGLLDEINALLERGRAVATAHLGERANAATLSGLFGGLEDG
ncbi:MAG: phage portal protein, partial [Desulfobacterales bacterium]|nr:phage portal protein [Desulfobacterales bacterium]